MQFSSRNQTIPPIQMHIFMNALWQWQWWWWWWWDDDDEQILLIEMNVYAVCISFLVYTFIFQFYFNKVMEHVLMLNNYYVYTISSTFQYKPYPLVYPVHEPYLNPVAIVYLYFKWTTLPSLTLYAFQIEFIIIGFWLYTYLWLSIWWLMTLDWMEYNWNVLYPGHGYVRCMFGLERYKVDDVLSL